MSARLRIRVTPGLLAAVLAVACTAGARGWGDDEALNQAFALRARGDPRRAAAVLEEMLPRTRNEEIYRTLGEIREADLHDYERASRLYRSYLDLFPEGRYALDCRNRLAYLTGHRRDWPVMARYKTILATYRTRTRAANIGLMAGLLREYPRTSLAPEIHSWLAWEYFQLGRSRPALAQIRRYLSLVPDDEEHRLDRLGAYQTWTAILIAAHRYGEAGRVLQQALDRGLEPALYETRAALLRKERRLWIGLLVSAACFALALAGAVLSRPWRNRDLGRHWPRFLLLSLAVWGGVLIPYWVVQGRGYGSYRSFPTLGALAELDLLLIWLLSPLGRRMGRPAQLAVAAALAAAGVYLAYYAWDNLSVFYQWPDFTS